VPESWANRQHGDNRDDEGRASQMGVFFEFVIREIAINHMTRILTSKSAGVSVPADNCRNWGQPCDNLIPA